MTELPIPEDDPTFLLLLQRLPIIVYEERMPPGGRSDRSKLAFYVPPGRTTLAGYPVEEYLTEPDYFWRHVIHPDDRERVLESTYYENPEIGQTDTVEYRAIYRDGSTHWVLDCSELVSREEDGTDVWIGFSQDITERKEAELGLERTVDELRHVDEARRELLRQLVRSQEDERARIAGELHDEIVQGMTAISLQLGALRRNLGKGHDLEDSAVGLERLISQEVQNLRKLMFELRPRALDEDGLAAAVRILVGQLTEATGVAGRLDDGLEVEPDRAIAGVAFRIIREALANVRKHASAEAVTVLLRNEGATLVARVSDDGVGFDPEALGPTVPGHFGLATMRERADSAGGTLEIRSASGEGTDVTATLPLAG